VRLRSSRGNFLWRSELRWLQRHSRARLEPLYRNKESNNIKIPQGDTTPRYRQIGNPSVIGALCAYVILRVFYRGAASCGGSSGTRAPGSSPCKGARTGYFGLTSIYLYLYLYLHRIPIYLSIYRYLCISIYIYLCVNIHIYIHTYILILTGALGLTREQG